MDLPPTSPSPEDSPHSTARSVERRAVIDIGTNSVKLLVADVLGRTVRPVLEQGEQTRLGRGFYQTHLLQRDAVELTARVVKVFAEQARAAGAEDIRAIATSAAREAGNASDLLEAVHHASGLSVEVIPGELEADWAFQGVTTDPALQDQALLILDVGGGSTEFIMGQGREQHLRQSFHLGTVRLFECLRIPDPPAEADWHRCRDWLGAFLAREIEPRLGEWSPRVRPAGLRLVGTGGTTAILARMALGLRTFDRDRIEGARLALPQVRQRREHLWGLPLSARRTLVGLPPERADVILTGVAIYETVMEFFHLPELWVSTRGLRFAAVMA